MSTSVPAEPTFTVGDIVQLKSDGIAMIAGAPSPQHGRRTHRQGLTSVRG